MRLPSGNDLELGHIVENGKTLTMPRDARSTHLYACGATGTGKSKFLEHLIRQDIVAWRKSKCGLLLLDPHGSLYDSLMRWLAWVPMDRPIVPIDLRRDDWIVGYNVLRQRPTADPAVTVNHFVQAMAYVWGQSDTSQTPLFNRWASNILWTLYEKEQTLLQTEHLTNRTSKRIRRMLTENLSRESVANDWALADTLSPKDFDGQIGSTLNRLHSFLAPQMLRRMFGQGGASLDLRQAMDEGQIILVSLATERGRVSDEDASLFATLLLSDLWAAAKERGKGTDRDRPNPFYVYADEFQNFVTPTMAKNLDQARGFGLHLTLAHQFPNQLLHVGAHGMQVYDSVLVNARSKAVFSLAGEDNLRAMALELFRGTMDPDKIKHELYSTKVMSYVEEYRRAYARARSESHTSGSQSGESAGTGRGGTRTRADGHLTESESWSRFKSGSESESQSHAEGMTESESETPMLIPQMGKELSSVQFEPLEEQLFRAMAALFDLEQRQCVTRLVGSRQPATLFTPTVNEVPGNPEFVARYVEKQLKRWPFMVQAAEAKRRLEAREAELRRLGEGDGDEPGSARRRIR